MVLHASPNTVILNAVKDPMRWLDSSAMPQNDMVLHASPNTVILNAVKDLIRW